jgi:hypothetical protein
MCWSRIQHAQESKSKKKGREVGGAGGGPAGRAKGQERRERRVAGRKGVCVCFGLGELEARRMLGVRA